MNYHQKETLTRVCPEARARVTGAVRVLVIVLGFLLLTGSLGAETIAGVTIEDVSSELTSFSRPAVETINGSGFDEAAGTHNTSASAMWLNTGTLSSDSLPDDPHIADPTDSRLAHITYDLGGLYEVSGFHVWNYNESGSSNRPARSTRDLEIRVSQTSTLSGLDATGPLNVLTDPSDSDQTFTLDKALGTEAYTGEFVAAAFEARYVRFDIFSNYPQADNDLVGLSEIRFEGTLVPEPGGLFLAFVVLGFVLSLRNRRSE